MFEICSLFNWDGSIFTLFFRVKDIFCNLFNEGTRFRSRERLMANLRFGEAVAEAEELGFSLSSSLDENLDHILQDLAQYRADPVTMTETDEEIFYDFDEIPHSRQSG